MAYTGHNLPIIFLQQKLIQKFKNKSICVIESLFCERATVGSADAGDALAATITCDVLPVTYLGDGGCATAPPPFGLTMNFLAT
jgi:hypothetical protein